jgi:hypothetical protein
LLPFILQAEQKGVVHTDEPDIFKASKFKHNI